MVAVDAARAIRKEIAATKKQLIRLEGALEIITGVRGIDGAPAENVGKSGRDKLKIKKRKDGQKRKRRGHGQLQQEIAELLSDGTERTTKEIATEIGCHVTNVLQTAQKIPGVKIYKEAKQGGGEVNFYKMEGRYGNP